MELSYIHWPHPKEGEVRQQRETEKILFLHGLGGNGSLWRPIAAMCEDQFDLLAADQRGHGKSPSGEAYPLLDMGQDVLDTMQSAHFHPAWIVGHSMGVRTAVAMAHLKPKWVRGLVLIDVGFTSATGGSIGKPLFDFLDRLPQSFNSRNEARDYLNKNCPDPAMGLYLLAVLSMHSTTTSASSQAPRPWTFPFDRNAMTEILKAAQTPPIRPWIKEATEKGIPVLALRGQTSSVWLKTHFEEEKNIFEHNPMISLEEFAGAGHGLPFEKRSEFVARLIRFIKENGDP